MEARFLLTRLERVRQRNDLGRRVLAVDEGPLERKIDETRRDAVLPDGNLPQHERLGARWLQHRQDLAHRRFETVDLVEEEKMRNAAILELLEYELERRYALGIRLADDHGSIAAGQYRIGLGLELDGARAVYESEAISQELHIGHVDLDAHAVIARFGHVVTDRVLVGDRPLARHGAGTGEDGFEECRLAGEIWTKDRDCAGAARCTAVGFKPHGFLLVAQAQGRVPRPAPELRLRGRSMIIFKWKYAAQPSET